MTDKKFTQEQIIKALECCGSYCCNECAYFNDDFCIENMTKQAIVLINKKEIKTEAIKEFAERLKEINNNRGWFCGVYNHDIDNLVKEMTEVN